MFRSECDFLGQIQCDESRQAAEDWFEYQRWLDGELEQDRIEDANTSFQRAKVDFSVLDEVLDVLRR